MSAHTAFTIDGIDLFIDPDQISINDNNIIQAERSLAGTSYVTYFNSNSPAFNRTVTFSGAYLPVASAALLLLSSHKKTPVVVGGGVIDPTLQHIIMSIRVNPIKPLVTVGTDATMKYAYDITLQQVD